MAAFNGKKTHNVIDHLMERSNQLSQRGEALDSIEEEDEVSPIKEFY